MGRRPCCDKVGVKRGPWTIEEDHKLVNFILNNGIKCWRLVPKLAGLLRCGKSCRLRWMNYLRPDLKRGAFTEAEENMIIQLHARLGNRWSKIAAHLPGRTDNEIKNHWNTKIKKKLKLLGLDPATHKPVEQQENDGTENGTIQLKNSSEKQEVMTTSADSQGTSNSQPNEEINLDHAMEITESLGMDSFIVENDESLDIFSMQIDNSQLEDPFRYWIGSPLSWDVLGYLGEDTF